MFLFGKSKKKKEAERKIQEELALQAKIKEEKKIKAAQEKQKEEAQKQAAAKKKAAPAKTKEVVKKAPAKKAPAKKAPVKKISVKKAPVKKAPVKKALIKEVAAKKAPSGKYEVYPEAGLYKYRLKASNGEILAVSFGYSTKSSAKNGVQTFKNAVSEGNFDISTDKSSFSHYDLFGSRGARVILIGEFYKTLKLAESAVESVKKFYKTDNINDLDKIPASEKREEIAVIPKTTANPNGKFQLIKEGKEYFIKLLASNAQVLLVSQGYTTKQAALNGLEAIKNAIASQNFTVGRDKQNRYQYNLYTANNQLIVSGETYPVKQSCLSSIQSVVRFAGKAELQEVK